MSVNVLVYSSPEVSHSSQASAIANLRDLLVPNYTVQTLSHQALISHPWSPTCALLILPACQPIISNAAIQSYVQNGGSLLAFSLGSKGFRGDLISDIENMTLSRQGSLRLGNHMENTYITLDFNQGDDNSLTTLDLESDGERVEGVYCQSPCPTLSGFDSLKGSKVLGRFPDGAIAGVRYSLGSGNVILWAVHLERTLSGVAENHRLNVLRRSLQECGLHIPNDATEPKTPLPQCLVGIPSIVDRILREISPGSTTQESFTFKDENDVFQFHPSAHCSSLLEEHRDPDPSTWQPKHILVYRDGSFPTKDQTPRFDIGLYYNELYKTREKETPNNDRCRIGEVLLYGEIVTSTQTMLDKNPRLLSHLPVPFLSLASHQLAGRGRGANIWLSPSGCLQFSLLLRVPFSSVPASKLVFIQYLFGLAVTEACRNKAVLGRLGDSVRLKWPNDVYAQVGEEKKKIGGVLVNTSFSGGQADVIVGCGLNVLNPPPITSLSQLVPQDVTISLERTAATIMTTFEPMWNTFIAHRGSFEPFMDLYLERWFHSNQIVTLTTTGPERKVRITGITSDYGLLRTIPERSGSWNAGMDDGFIDLQPDGNSFDIMSGLIKSKT